MMYEHILMLTIMIFIGGFIGFMTNKIAIKMLFRPIKPITFFGITIQGMLPKRKGRIAESIGQTIESAFLSKEDIIATFMTDEMRERFKTTLKSQIIQSVFDFMPTMLKRLLKDSLEDVIIRYIDKEGDTLINDLFKALESEGLASLDISSMAKDRVDELDMLAFEKLVIDIVNKELRHIELIGLFLGMMIGFIQFWIYYFI